MPLHKPLDPIEEADKLFLHLRDNWYNLCGLDSQTEFLDVWFEHMKQWQKNMPITPPVTTTDFTHSF